MNKQLMAQVIYEGFNYIYCSNCKYEGRDNCDECHRKSMGWEVSESYAESVAQAIIDAHKKEAAGSAE